MLLTVAREQEGPHGTAPGPPSRQRERGTLQAEPGARGLRERAGEAGRRAEDRFVGRLVISRLWASGCPWAPGPDPAVVMAQQREPEGKNPLGCGPGLLVGTRAAQLWARPYCVSLEGAGSTRTRGHRGREVAPPVALVALAWWQRQSPPVTFSCTSTRRLGSGCQSSQALCAQRRPRCPICVLPSLYVVFCET